MHLDLHVASVVTATHTHTHHLLWARQNDLRPAPDNLHLGCSYHLHSIHRFLSTWGVVMLGKKIQKLLALANIKNLNTYRYL